MPLEIKDCLVDTNFYSEQLGMEANLGLQAWENDGDPIYVEVDAESDNLMKWIPKRSKSFQLMHYVAVRDVQKGLFLVGCTKKVIVGVFVTYSDRLIRDYQSVLKDMFERALTPFYASVHDLQLCSPWKKITEIINEKGMKAVGFSWHPFSTHFLI